MSSCSALDSCQGLPDEEKMLVNTLLGLPGLDSEWAQVLENGKLLAEQFRTSLKDDDLGKDALRISNQKSLLKLLET